MKVIIVTIVALVIAGLLRLDFYVWRKIHPQAPTWTYFVRSH